MVLTYRRSRDATGDCSDGPVSEAPASSSCHRAGDAAVDLDEIKVRLPVDWDSVDPDALAAIMAQPGSVDVPLDDVVPGEPESASTKVHA